ncbi:hypothetical protein EG68_05823 [Paragonimus skrjabini miyazakii]|uniref:Uncharacterized protein n=1 Tax=Paragonimus skrjabini miyazakii TaxID=59628 RepID=A0A8S9YV31_9TREM|nr:hypothetical protein EG68_05823 [Paragonimus skrjabini miyazakii]
MFLDIAKGLEYLLSNGFIYGKSLNSSMIFLDSRLHCKLRVRVYPTLVPTRWTNPNDTLGKQNLSTLLKHDPCLYRAPTFFRSPRWSSSPCAPTRVSSNLDFSTNLLLNNEYAILKQPRMDLLETVEVHNTLDQTGSQKTIHKNSSINRSSISHLYRTVIQKLSSEEPILPADQLVRMNQQTIHQFTDVWCSLQSEDIWQYGAIQLELLVARLLLDNEHTRSVRQFTQSEDRETMTKSPLLLDSALCSCTSQPSASVTSYDVPVQTDASSATTMQTSNRESRTPSGLSASISPSFARQIRRSCVSDLLEFNTIEELSYLVSEHFPSSGLNALLLGCRHPLRVHRWNIRQAREMCEYIQTTFSGSRTMVNKKYSKWYVDGYV